MDGRHMNRLPILAVLLLAPATTPATTAESGGHGELPHHHLAIFAGGAQESKEGREDVYGFAAMMPISSYCLD